MSSTRAIFSSYRMGGGANISALSAPLKCFSLWSFVFENKCFPLCLSKKLINVKVVLVLRWKQDVWKGDKKNYIDFYLS